MRMLSLGFLALVAGLATAAESPVTVNYIEPKQFTDVQDSRSHVINPDRNTHLRSLRKWLQKQGPRWLGDGQQLQIEFTDIDLAGDYEPIVHPSLDDVRIIKSIYPPRLQFRYRLTDASGRVLSEGEENLRDLGFDVHAITRNSDPLRYEKRMLERWAEQALDQP
ncbi:MAG: DUF3016 domain-containing protein [Xanthomonadales bacterium]|nr:DUF3016 domain-containing protein [Xanthomonadales bacterium]